MYIDESKLSSILKDIRLSKHLSREDVSLALGISPGQLLNFEKSTSMTKLETIQLLCQYYELNPLDILEDAVFDDIEWFNDDLETTLKKIKNYDYSNTQQFLKHIEKSFDHYSVKSSFDLDKIYDYFYMNYLIINKSSPGDAILYYKEKNKDLITNLNEVKLFSLGFYERKSLMAYSCSNAMLFDSDKAIYYYEAILNSTSPLNEKIIILINLSIIYKNMEDYIKCLDRANMAHKLANSPECICYLPSIFMLKAQSKYQLNLDFREDLLSALVLCKNIFPETLYKTFLTNDYSKYSFDPVNLKFK